MQENVKISKIDKKKKQTIKKKKILLKKIETVISFRQTSQNEST